LETKVHHLVEENSTKDSNVSNLRSQIESLENRVRDYSSKLEEEEKKMLKNVEKC